MSSEQKQRHKVFLRTGSHALSQVTPIWCRGRVVVIIDFYKLNRFTEGDGNTIQDLENADWNTENLTDVDSEWMNELT